MRFGYGRVAKAMRLLLSAVKFVCGLFEVCFSVTTLFVLAVAFLVNAGRGRSRISSVWRSG